MSEKADKFLQDTEDGAFMYVSNPELYKRLCGYMESYHKHQMEKVFEKAEKEIEDFFTINASMSNLMQETIVDEKRGAKWLLEQLKKEFNS